MEFLQTRIVSSLEKVFCAPELNAEPLARLSGGHGETVSFQIACRAEDPVRARIEVESELEPFLRIREVGLVPCEMPAMPDDPDILSSRAGLYPDPLYPVDRTIKLSRANWHALWVSVLIPDRIPDGVFPIRFRIFNPDSTEPESRRGFSESCSLSLDIMPFRLPKQKLICTNWLYADCICSRYHVKCWSEAHWNLLEHYFRNMAEHGINMLLTPLWTVPLDTAVNHERPTAQLLQIEYADGVYRFDFSRLERWINLARSCGIEYLEMSHAFTQWGAMYTPKIVVTENGAEKQKFGWRVKADSPDYADFLRQLMPLLLQFLRGRDLSGRCYFHISDEPEKSHLDSYRKAVELFRPLAEDFPVIDAMSDVEFFRRGLSDRPVPTTEKLDEFATEPVAQRWVYYCGNYRKTPNRQFGMPSSRNRILGVILYLYNLDGFLNWGYNFWYTQYSLSPLDPFRDTTAGRAFCGGGSFQVYPGEDGPIDSLHYEVFREGLQDLRALRLLEQKIGRDAVISLIHRGLDYRISITRYPLNPGWLLTFRRTLNQALTENMRPDGYVLS